MREQLLEREAALRRMLAGRELAELRLARRPMHHTSSASAQRRQPERLEHAAGGIQSRTPAALELRAAPVRRARAGALGTPFGARVDRRERLFERLSAPAPTRRYSGCTISSPSGPRRTSPKQRMRVPRASVVLLRAPRNRRSAASAKPVPSAMRHSSWRRRRIHDFGELDLRLRPPRARPARSAPIGATLRAVFVARAAARTAGPAPA